MGKSPFQRVVDDLTNGCGCACHTGTGYATACVHCQSAVVLPDDEVCACLHETGERKVRLYERCQRCGAFMEADYLVTEKSPYA